ncbi:MAG: tetratricopeptide repeat protein [Methanolinea sp.]|nr:tetratricopeptide repeat protein [Methanolinea sp.]
MKAEFILACIFCILLAAVLPCSAASSPDAISAYNRGVDLAMEGKFDDALASIDQAISLDQNFTLAWITKAGILNVKGSFNESLVASERALAIDGNQADAWTNKASALISLQRFEEGLEAANRAIELDPRLSEAWIDRATALSSLNRTAEAEEAMKMAMFLMETPEGTPSPLPTTRAAPLFPLLALLGTGIALLLARKGLR